MEKKLKVRTVTGTLAVLSTSDYDWEGDTLGFLTVIAHALSRHAEGLHAG